MNSSTPNAAPSETPSVKILLVDDRQDNLDPMRELLGSDGLEVFVATSGERALEVLARHPIALVVLDVQMPSMSGFEVAERMRAHEAMSSVPILFVTAEASDRQHVFRGYEAGAVDFLQKPIDGRILKQKVCTFVKLHRQKLELASRMRQLEASMAERDKLVGELTDALRIADLFSVVLGHDLRSPLGVITLCADLLLKHGEDEHVHKTATRVLSSSRRMSRMIDELLEVSRARLNGGHSITPRPTDLARLCERVVVEQRAGNVRTPKVSHRGDPNGEWDEARLGQAIGHLYANALLHAVAETPVYLHVDASATNELVVSMRNDAVLEPEVLATLFDPWVDKHTRREPSDGLGLGLYIARQIARAHGGDAGAESSPDSGMRFWLRVPRVSAPRTLDADRLRA